MSRAVVGRYTKFHSAVTSFVLLTAACSSSDDGKKGDSQAASSGSGGAHSSSSGSGGSKGGSSGRTGETMDAGTTQSAQGGARATGDGGKGGSKARAGAGGHAANDDADAGPRDSAGSGGMSEPAAGSGGESGDDQGEPAAGGGGTSGGATNSACSSDVAPTIPPLKLQTIVASESLSTLAYAAQPPGSDDWYVVEQRGRILTVRDGQLLDRPFLDLTSEIQLGAGFDQTTVTYDERGLVGLAFAPDYQDSGLFYITITPSAPDNPLAPGLQQDHDQVLEWKRSGDDADRAEDGPTRSLVDVGSAPVVLGNIHNANTVRFGPDGMLYVGMGDGGGVSCGDAENNASQDITRVFGKILRLDLSRDAPYGAADNPFADVPGAETVLHYGLRNPFRWNFDRETGDLYVGDVGQDTFEEIDFAASGSRGLNFGWAKYEAKSICPGPARALRDDSTPTDPIFAADRAGTGPYRDFRAIVGGVVYRGSAIPELVGTYIFGDYYGSRFGALQRCAGETSPITGIRKNCDPNFPEPCMDADADAPQLQQLTAIVEDHAGEIHLVANGNSLLKVTKP